MSAVSELYDMPWIELRDGNSGWLTGERKRQISRSVRGAERLVMVLGEER